MTRSLELPPFRFPISEKLLLQLVRGLGLPEGERVLEIGSGRGSCALRLARDLGLVVTGLDGSEEVLREARSMAVEHDLTDRVELVHIDPRRWELPVASYRLVVALGGVVTALGALTALERIWVHLEPGGCLLLGDPVYLASPPPPAARAWLAHAKTPPLEERPSPEVRAVFEGGLHRIATESEWVGLLEALGYEVEWSCLAAETTWGEYFEQAALVPEHQEAALEAVAYYGHGGRARVGSLLLLARRPLG